MKKIYNIIFIALISISCKSQSNTINLIERCSQNYSNTNGTVYLKDLSNLYTPFVGTWKWTEGNRELTLTLIKQTKFHYNQGSDNYYKDRIVGYYIYKENGVALINTTTDNLSDDYGVKVDFDIDCYSQLVGSIDDIPKNKRYDGWIELLSPSTIKFHFKEDTHMRIQKEGYPALPPRYVGNTFPLEMILTKQ